MNRQPVSSSTIRSVGYDSESKTLEIEFENGGIYQYFGVPQDVYQRFMSASSKGKFHHAHIKDRYRYSKVGR